MRISMILATAATIATGLAGTAHAADRATERFVYRIQSDAAFDGVEVSRIQRRGNLVLVHGEDRQGRQIVTRRHCDEKGLECPAIRVAAQQPATAHGSIMPLGGGLHSYQTGR
jgi:hypothetical protein